MPTTKTSTRGGDAVPSASASPWRWPPRWSIWVFAVVVVACALEYWRIISACNGHFIYTLDDPYIHLALSEHLHEGHYGLSAAEVSSPASSILWPFLLSWAAPYRFHVLLPLLYNLLILMFTAGLLCRLVDDLFSAPPCAHVRGARFYAAACGLAVLFILLWSNAIGLVFTGMEHSLQVLLTLCALAGLYRLQSTGKIGFALVLGVVLGPLVRYENLAVSVGAVALVACQRKRRAALALALGFLAPMAAFSGFLISAGLPALPSSVLVKSRLGMDGTAPTTLGRLVGQLRDGLLPPRPLVVFGGLLAGWLLWTRRKPTSPPARSLAWMGVFVATGHLVAGRFEWFGRYEAYVNLLLLAIGLVVFRDAMGRFFIARPFSPTSLFGVAALSGIFYVSLRPTFQTPTAAGEVYRQQYQLHRFVAEVHRGPVAVNDLGWVSYRNPYEVLDLWGLGSEIARKGRAEHVTGWMPTIVARHKVPVAMVYEEWVAGEAHSAEPQRLGAPPGWTLVGRLDCGASHVAVAKTEVAFYATAPAYVATLQAQLAAFAKMLPPGVVLKPSPPPALEGPGS